MWLTGKPCRPIQDDGYPDVAIYNSELEKLGKPTWLKTPWLYTECYLFRYVHSSLGRYLHPLMLRRSS